MAPDQASATATSRIQPPDDLIPRLGAELRGRVIVPEDPDYDEARAVFPGGIDRRPAVIARVADAADVASVIAAARETGLELAVRSGGHSAAGHGVCDGGIVLDLAEMRALEIDPARRTAWAEPGLTAGEYAKAAGAHGLATGFGDAPSVGIGGITVGGGVGFLVRKYGLTIDDLLAAEIVTADGRLLRADPETNADLFWAIRGGGGNFGVATRFQFRLHELDRVLGGMLVLPATSEVIASFVAAAEAAPFELSTIANVMPAPPMPFVPAEHHGELVVMATLVYAGDAEQGERAIAPFRALATPIADLLRPMAYPEAYPPEDPDYHPVATMRSMFLDSVDRATAELILERLRASTAQMAVTQLRVLGGAMALVPAGATAFAHRDRRVMANVAAIHNGQGGAEDHQAWVSGFADALRQGGRGVYVNFLGDEGEARVREAYPGSTWERLAAVKARYDPTNLFRRNQNIPPAG
jgi:FAD/FMN-containing dehydrogenase